MIKKSDEKNPKSCILLKRPKIALLGEKKFPLRTPPPIGQKSLEKGETEDTPHLYIPPRGVGGCLESIKIFRDFW